MQHKRALRYIERLCRVIERGNLSYDRTTYAIIQLANACHEYSGETGDWLYLDSYGFTPDAIIVGAFWHYTEWHGGQWSAGYAALCACGQVFSPGMADGPEPGSCEQEIFDILEQMAENRECTTTTAAERKDHDA